MSTHACASSIGSYVASYMLAATSGHSPQPHTEKKRKRWPGTLLRLRRLRRRADLMALFRTHVYGTAPEDSYSSTTCAMTHELLSSEVALGGLAVRREIMLCLSGPSGERKKWVVLLYLPVGASSSAPIPCFLGLNFSGNHTVHPDPGITESVVVEPGFAGKERGAATERWQVEKIVSRGMAVATVYSGDVEPDDPETAFSNGVHKLFAGYNPEDWGTVAAVSC